MGNVTFAGSGYGRRVRHESEPWLPYQRVEYWLSKAASKMGTDQTSLHYEFRSGRFEACIVDEGRHVPIAVVFGLHGQEIDSVLRKLAWTLQEMCHG